jgi:hypothetical protein
MKDSNRLRTSWVLKLLFLLVATFNGLLGLLSIKGSISIPDIYRKDFLQEYLMAKAILNGINPYLPVRELAQIWLSDATAYNAITHPSLHPPLMGLLSLPLGLLSYQQASLVWLAFESACMLIALMLIFRGFGKPIEPLVLFVLLFMALGFGPVEDELWYGQLNALLLLLMVGSWLALRAGKGSMGGALLGGVIALKWIAWPFVLFLIIRRKWKSIIMVAVVLGAANLLAMLVLGFRIVKDYYLNVVPSAAYIRTFEFNLSASAFGLHLFTELGWYHKLIPLWNSPKLALVSSYSIMLAVLLIGLGMALRASTFDTAFGLLTVVSILVSPVAWSHYLLLAAIPFAILMNGLSKLGFPRPFPIRLLCIMCPLLITSKMYGGLLRIISAQETPEGVHIVPFVPGLLLMLPTASLIGLLWLLWRLDSIQSQPQIWVVSPP